MRSVLLESGLPFYTAGLSIALDPRVEAQRLAIMFADLAGSSALYKQLGDGQARPLVRQAVSRMALAVARHGGTVIKTIGDEIMASFPLAEQAVACALAMQRDTLHPIDGHLLPLRIGVNLGEALVEGGDVFGEAVNDAAALVKIARAHQILIREPTALALNPEQRRQLSLFDRVALKGGKTTENILLVSWEDNNHAHATMIMGAVPTLSPAVPPRLQLQSAGQPMELTPEDCPLHIGRDRLRCRLHIDSPQASRDHCTIDYRRGKFVLLDHSTNGTYVRLASGRQVYLRREELPLVGSGDIGVGALPGHAATTLEFTAP